MSDSDNRKIFGVIVECAKLTPEIFVKAIEEMTKDSINRRRERQALTSLCKRARWTILRSMTAI